MKALKPLSPNLITKALRSSGYPANNVSTELRNTLMRLTFEQIQEGKDVNEISQYLAMTAANRLPASIQAVDFCQALGKAFTDTNAE